MKMKWILVVAGVCITLVAGTAAVTVFAFTSMVGSHHGGPPGGSNRFSNVKASTVKNSACATKQYAVPANVQSMLSSKQGLPASVTYKSVKYNPVSRVTNVNLKTMKAASGLTISGHDVYVDSSATCTSLYVSVSRGPFNLAVYTQSK